MTRPLTGEGVARMWLYRGVGDLYFAFHIESSKFNDHAMFMMIMGLEKHLKAVLLFNKRTEYESLSRQQALEKVNQLAKGLGHKFAKILSEATTLTSGKVRPVSGIDFEGFDGAALMEALFVGYEETRYPVPKPAWKSHPIKEFPDTYQDPLCSSGTDTLIRRLCTDCFDYLDGVVTDLNDVLAKVANEYGGEESFARFQNVYLASRWSKIEPRT